MRERLNALIASHTGQPIDKVAKDTDRDFWMSPDEAAEYGLVDKVQQIVAQRLKTDLNRNRYTPETVYTVGVAIRNGTQHLISVEWGGRIDKPCAGGLIRGQIRGMYVGR